MAIKYTPEFNEEIRRRVSNYNRRQASAEKAGVKRLPGKVKVSNLKGSYTNRKDLERELNRLDKFTRKQAEKRIEIDGGTITGWEKNFVKNNLDNAKEYFLKEHARVSKRATKYPGEQLYVNNIQSKINLLSLSLDEMNLDQFKSAKAAINQFVEAPTKLKASYRGFLSEVYNVMDMLGYSDEEKESIAKKFDGLTPTQFLYAYDNNDIIGRVYELADSPIYGDLKLNTTEKDAKEILQAFSESIDDIIADAKLNAV